MAVVVRKLSKQKLHLSNLPKLFQEQWFENEVYTWQPDIDKVIQRGVKRDYSDDQFLHEFVVQALKDRQYIVAAYVINERFDIFGQSPMAYAMSLNDPSLLFVLLALGNDVNGQYYKDIDDVDDHYSLLRLAYENGSEPLFNLLLLHPSINLNRTEWSISDLSEISVFLGQGYQYDYFYPALILLDEKYQQIWPYLSIDVNHEYENGNTLFLVASEQEDYQRMTRLYQLGANIHPDSYNWGSPLFQGLSEYERKGKSRLLDWYANIYEPLIYQDPDVGGGLLGLLEPDVSDEVREQFGLQFWPLIRKFDEHFLAKQQYRLFAPNLNPVFEYSPELAILAEQMDSYVSSFMRRRNLQAVSILNDMQRVYKVDFANDILDLKVCLENGHIQLTVVEYFESQDFMLRSSLSEKLLQPNIKYVELTELTEFQLCYLLLSASIEDWIEVHTYIKDTFGYELFCFSSYDEYIKYRGISDKDTESAYNAERGVRAFL